MRTLLRASLASVLSLFVFIGPVSAATNTATTIAQATQTGTITGQVTGDAGTGLSGAQVLIEGSGQRQTTTTDGSGNFTATLPPGLYTVTVLKGGYQTGSNDVTVAAGTTSAVNIGLTAASLNNLNVIGRTSTTSGRNAAKFNISSSAAQSLSQQNIIERNVPDLTQVLNELPGITIPHATSNPSQSFLIRGLRYESKTEIDGHPVSSGTGGTFLTNYTSSAIFGGVDVVKGAGLNGPTSGEAGIGIVNLKTPDFGTKDSAFVQGALDNYSGSLYTVLIDKNFLKNNKLSFVLGYSFVGYNGPTAGLQEPDYTGASIPASTNMQIPTLTNGLVQYIQDFSNTYGLTSELAKMRYKFSDATSISFEFLGNQGKYQPQGGAYGQFAGYLTVPQCLVAAKASAVCNTQSEYNSPAAFPLIGTNVPIYAFYPGSFVRQNQPNFNAEFKTTIGNDTLQFRPYTATINRLIDGTQENTIPGDNGGGWYQVTNSANCQATFVAVSVANNGAKGPCFSAAGAPTAAYIGADQTPVVYATTSTALTCTAAAPCYTTSTGLNNGGQVGYGSPYTTLEIDKLFGYTFNYIHPVGANVYNISYDHYYDDATALINDASPLPAGCTFVLSSSANTPGLAGSQPSCPLATLRPSPLSVPETFSSIGSIALTAQFALTPKFEFDFGGYFTHYTINAQQINPSALIAGARSGATPINLVGSTNSASHFDPHFGILYRPTRDLTFRFTGGSSLSIPYASLVSGFQTTALGATSDTISAPNYGLLPEELVSLDLGSDYRTPDGTVLSGDIYNTVVHNPWLSTKVLFCGSIAACAVAPQLAGFVAPQQGYTSQTLNGAQQYLQGVEFSITHEPVVGFGYRINSAFERNYYLQTPASYFGGNAQTFFNGNQFVSTGSGNTSTPYAKGYVEVRYANAKQSFIRFGADYEGNNNSYNANAFWIFDGGIQVNTGFHDVMLGVTGENLFNTNFGALVGRGVEFQGLDPIAGTPSATGYTYSQPFNSALVAPSPVTYRFTLTKRF